MLANHSISAGISAKPWNSGAVSARELVGGTGEGANTPFWSVSFIARVKNAYQHLSGM